MYILYNLFLFHMYNNTIEKILMYERLTKHNISDQYVQKQLAEFTAIEREYKLKQLIDTF